MPCEWRGNITNDLKPNLFIILKSNEFWKLKGFLKHDHLHNSHSQSQNNILDMLHSTNIQKNKMEEKNQNK
jgi:DUF1365 family protein